MGGVLVLWDLDFTLLNAGGVGAAVYAEVFRELFGRDLASIPPMAGRTERAIILDTLTGAGIAAPAGHIDAFVAALSTRAPALREVFASRGRALPGAAAAIAAVAALDGAPARLIVQSVLTGNVRAVAHAKVAAFGLGDHLDLSVGAYGEHHEVRAELVHLARRQAEAVYGVDFSGAATVLVGDTPLDVAAALASGARVVGVATGGSTVADLLAAGAHAALPDLTDTAAVLAAILGGLRPGASSAEPDSAQAPSHKAQII